MQSGRMPSGSRNATSLFSASATTENAPSSFDIACATASSSGAGSFAISAAIISLSEVECTRMPCFAISSRSSAALVRLPLCPSATVRARPLWTSGCAFAQCAEPVVE